MRPTPLLLALLQLAALPASATAQAPIEDFEHGQTSLYTGIGGSLDNLSFLPGAAHDGALGAYFATGGSPYWYYRTDIATSAGNTYRAYVRSAGTNSRAYLGFGAGAGGGFSVVTAWNSSALIIQDNQGWGYSNLVSASATLQVNVWYLMELEWGFTGDLTARLWDETGAVLLAQTPTYASSFTGSGGLAMRSFVFSAPDTFIDTVHVLGGGAGFLLADQTHLSLSSGGVCNFVLSAGSQLAGNPYLLMGSHSGIAPGIPIDATQTLPLNPDPYWLFTLTTPNLPPLTNSYGSLDTSGMAQASFSLPSGSNPLFAGIDVHHAFVAIDTTIPGLPAVGFTSDAVGFQFAP